MPTPPGYRRSGKPLPARSVQRERRKAQEWTLPSGEGRAPGRVQGSEQSRVKPQLRHRILQCSPFTCRWIGAPQTSHVSSSAGAFWGADWPGADDDVPGSGAVSSRARDVVMSRVYVAGQMPATQGRSPRTSAPAGEPDPCQGFDRHRAADRQRQRLRHGELDQRLAIGRHGGPGLLDTGSGALFQLRRRLLQLRHRAFHGPGLVAHLLDLRVDHAVEDQE